MTIEQYEEAAKRTSKYKTNQDKFVGCAFGACGEVGEMAGKIEKRMRKGDPAFPVTEEGRLALLDEIGDSIWFLVGVIESLGSSLGYVMHRNQYKLEDRDERGVIHGEGDYR